MKDSPSTPPTPERVTLRTVAKATGYTTATVSMALRNKEQINPKTRRKIQAAARKLGYTPDPAITELMFRLRAEKAPQQKAAIALASMFTRSQHRENPHLAIGIHYLKKAAADYGYRLEIFPLYEYAAHPGSMERILMARGIRGLILGGLPSNRPPIEVDISQFSAATVGYSRKISVHRACQHQYADTRTLMAELWQRGFRRPGLILPRDSDQRVNFHYSAAFRVFLSHIPPASRIEPAIVEDLTPEILLQWVAQSRPDVLITHAPSPDIIQTWLEKGGYRIPHDISMAILDLPEAKGNYAGMVQNLPHTAGAAIDLVINQIHRDQRGLQENPKTVMLEGTFFPGPSLNPPAAPA